MKKVITSLLLLWVAFACICPARGEFVPHELVDVPIARLVGNLERQLAQNANDGRTLYYLARAEVMAAAQPMTNTVLIFTDAGLPRYVNGSANIYQAPAIVGHPTNAFRHFERALALLPKSTNRDDRLLILPANLGYGWALHQAGQTNDAIRQYRITLELAWSKEVGTKMGELMDTVRATVRDEKWSGWRTRVLGPDTCFSEETIRYLLRLLDPVRNAEEIADLKRRQTALSRMPRVVTPVTVPLSEETGLRSLINPAASVPFDLDGSGLPRRWGWITDRAAWLVWDPRHTGKITSGLQLFGAVTFWIFWRDGYEPLAALDDDGNGVLEGRELDGLALWHDLNGNGISEPGEVRPAAEWGIIGLRCRPQRQTDGTPFHPQGVILREGNPRPSYDWSAPLAREPLR